MLHEIKWLMIKCLSFDNISVRVNDNWNLMEWKIFFKKCFNYDKGAK